MPTELMVNPTNPREINLAVALVRSLATKKRPQRLTISEWRPRRSDRQNALYWVAVIQPFADYLAEEGYGKEYGDLNEYAHQTLKDELLRVPRINPNTGEVVGYRTRSTTELTTQEFSQYVEDCARWLAEHTECQVHLPSDVMA